MLVQINIVLIKKTKTAKEPSRLLHPERARGDSGEKNSIKRYEQEERSSKTRLQ